MSRNGLRSVLVCATGPLGDRLAGPEIRAVEFAKALSTDFAVTLAAQRDDSCVRDGLRVVPSRRQQILREAMNHDAVLSPSLPPYLLALKVPLGIAAIADVYDPYENELASLGGEHHDRELRVRAMIQALHLRHADLVLCAAQSQREQLLLASAKLTRGKGAAPADPVVVPFGISDPPHPCTRRRLRERFPQIRENDTVVLWWGTVWSWLDVETPLRAFARFASTRPDVKLVVTAGRPPNGNHQRFEATEQARGLAAELGVLGRTVLFLDEWIPYELRHDYLGEADIGLTLHRFSAEAALAARARYMDYLSARLPCVLGRGDDTSAELEAAGFATLLDRPDPALLADTLLALADDRQALAAARDAGERLAAHRQWAVMGETLRAALRSLPRRPASSGISLAALGGTGAYYGRKIADRVTAA